MKVVGRGGVELHERRDGDARAYPGVTVPRSVNGSIIWFSECEVRYVMDCIRTSIAWSRTRSVPRPRGHSTPA